MRKRLLVALNVLLAAGLAWSLLGGAGSAGAAGAQLVNLPAPTFVGVPKSTHNDGVAQPPDACGGQMQQFVQGDEHFGDLNASDGSYLEFVRLPQGARVTSLSLFANDFDTDQDAHAFLVRKLIADGTHPKETGYRTMAEASSNGAVDSTIREFTDTTISGAVVDNTRFSYFAELVVCGATEPFAVQVAYTGG